jgi:hypothetical protein
MRIYKYFYYRMYIWDLEAWGKGNYPEYTALIGVSFVMFLNIIFITLILDICGISPMVFDSSNTYKSISGPIYCFISALNYLWLIRNGKYKNIVNDFKNESYNKRRRNTVLLWIFFFASLIMPMLGAVLLGRIKDLR